MDVDYSQKQTLHIIHVDGIVTLLNTTKEMKFVNHCAMTMEPVHLGYAISLSALFVRR
jgi:hypothetical protein